MKYAPFLSKIKNKIDRAKVISFDVFDTLLLRPYLEPTDLFLHIEKSMDISCFQSVRIESEREARRKKTGREDITFDEIYEEIDDIFKPLKQTELDWEMRVLTQNPELKQVYDYAKSQNKKIVIASDMYLPTDFIAEALNKNGFDGYDSIYVSGDLGKTKTTGTMYKHVCSQLKIAPDEILHIGDNKRSDYKRPKKLGIRAICYSQVSRQFIKSSPRIEDFKKQTAGSLDASILTAVLAMRWQKKMLDNAGPGSYFAGIGYEYAGPAAYGYTRWIESQAKNTGLNNLLFVARDGYTLQKVFDSFGSKIKSHYVYAPRFLNLICRLDYARKDKKQSNAIIEYFSGLDPEIRKLAEAQNLCGWEALHNFIQENKSLFIKHAVKEKNNYKKYLSQIRLGGNAKIGIVDTITGAFSSQKLLQDTLDSPVTGFYWSVIKLQFQGTYNHMQFAPNNGYGRNDHKCFTKNWDFMEFLLTSPEYPIKKITPDGKPVYNDSPDASETIRSTVYPQVSAGAIAFADDIRRLFGGENIFFESATLAKWINCFCDHPTKTDIAEMSEIKYAPDSDHKQYIPLFSTATPLGYILRHPLKVRNIAKKIIWRTPLQTLVLNLFSPLKVRTNGLRHLGLHILPKLAKQYFICRLKLTDKWYYDIIVGKEDHEKQRL